MKRLLILPLIAAAAWGQGIPTPVINRLDAFLAAGGGPGGAAVTAGVGNINLQITGSGFLPPVIINAGVFPQSLVQWISSGGITTQLIPASVNAAGTQLVVAVPASLIAQPGNVLVKVSNADGGDSGPSPFLVNAFLQVRSLPNGTVGIAYLQDLITGGTGPFAVQLSSGSLPAPLQLSAAPPRISGAPNTAGTYPFVARITDAWGQALNGQYSITVQPAPLTITTASPLPAATSGASYTTFFSAAGGIAPYSWTVASGGSLPPGLTLSSGGILSGIPLVNGTYTFGITVSGAGGPGVAASLATASFTLTVLAPAIPDLTISTASLPNGVVGAAYLTQGVATGGETPYSWVFTGLPPGLSGDPLGAIRGTPAQYGSYTVSLAVTDKGARRAAASLTLQIDPAPLVITTGALPDAAQNQVYSAGFAATGGVPPYTWTVVGGSLPPGVTFSSGALSGTPTAAGAFDFSVTATDSKQKTANKAFRLNVQNTAVTITTGSPLPDGMVGSAYSAGLGATGGTPPYKWSASGLPDGLGLDANGVISGTPSAPGAATVSATATDSKGVTATKSLGLTIQPAGLRITTTTIPDGTLGASYSQSFAAAGGVPPYRWALTAGYAGSGLTFSGDGTLSGRPLETGASTIWIQATDSANKTVVGMFTFNVAPASLVITTTSPLAAGMVGTAYVQSFAVGGNVAPVTWSAGGVPPGLSMASDGTLFGTPAAAGSFTLNVQVVEASNRVGGRTASGTFTLTVGVPPLPTVTFSGVPDASDPGKQQTLSLGLSGTYPLPVTGTVTLTFRPVSGSGDPAVQFSTGGATVQFTIPAGANLATFPVPNLGIQTGTVAGTITLTTTFQAGGGDVTPSPAPAQTLRINSTPPVITAVTATRTTAGFDVQVTGYSPPREASRGAFIFNAASTGNLGTTQQAVTVDAQFAAWFQGSASAPFGSRFTFVQSFSVTGSSSAIASVGVTLTNSVGTSNSVTANLQ